MLRKPFEYFGGYLLNSLNGLSSFFAFSIQACKLVFQRPFRLRLLLQQLAFLGNESIFIILISGFFIGAVFSVQIGAVFDVFGAESMIGAATGKALARELGPLLTGFLLAGRGGAAITAELATMKVNEQVDAMEAMAVDPVSYLVVPRLISLTLAVPLLVGMFNLTGQIGSLVVSTSLFEVDQGVYFSKLVNIVEVSDISSGMFKAVIFGFVTALISCKYGINASGGAKGVGKAVTESVVTTLLAILGIDLVVTYFQVVF